MARSPLVFRASPDELVMEIMGTGTGTVWTAFAVSASDLASRSVRQAAARAAARRREPAIQSPPPVEGTGTSIDVCL
jgi:hypothetical protein